MTARTHATLALACALLLLAGGPAVAARGEVLGTSGPDLLRGTGDANRMDGLGGSDELRGRGGADRLRAGRGSDQHWTSKAEIYCWEDYKLALDEIAPNVIVTDPLSVAQAWGRQ